MPDHPTVDIRRLEEEYKACINYNKHCTTIQFAHFSVFLAVMLAGIKFLCGDELPSEPLVKIGRLGMTFLAGCFGIIGVSHGYMSGKFFSRAAELEIKLGYEGLSKMPGMPKYRIKPAFCALTSMYIAFCVFWVLSFVARWMPGWSQWFW